MNGKNSHKLTITRRLLPLLVSLILSGCVCGAVALFAAPTLASTATFTPNPTNMPTNTPPPTSESTPPPASLSAADIYALISPSVAFIETSAGTGSGVLIEDGYVVTNAHVVWPFQEVRVVFPDGSEYLNAPVVNWDFLGGLPIIKQHKTSISPVALVDGEELIIGSDVYLIGYPGETESFPQPTFTRGLISRRREWAAIEMTYFQTDALIAGGQSGGVLVSEQGEIIGISGFSFTEAGFGLVASSADVLPRVERLIAGGDITGLGDRRMPLAAGQIEHNFRLRNGWDNTMYVINEPVGTVVDIEVESKNNAAFALFDIFGNFLLLADDNSKGVERGSATINFAAPHFLLVAQFTEDPGEFHVTSNSRLIPFEDRDDGAQVTVGQTLQGGVDHRGDFDHFIIDLTEGETIDITVDSVMIDPFLSIGFPEATDEQIVLADDSGGGLFGLNAELTYKAPHSGRYFITVEDALGFNVGGYFLTVVEAPPDAIPVIVEPTAAPIITPFGDMVQYENTRHPFTIQYPADWTESSANSFLCSFATVCFVSDQGGVLAIVEEDLELGEITLEAYTDEIVANAETTEPLSREQISNSQGLSVKVIEYLFQRELFVVNQLIYIHEGNTGFIVTYLIPKGRYDELEALIDYSFDTFSVGNPVQ